MINQGPNFVTQKNSELIHLIHSDDFKGFVAWLEENANREFPVVIGLPVLSTLVRTNACDMLFCLLEDHFNQVSHNYTNFKHTLFHLALDNQNSIISAMILRRGGMMVSQRDVTLKSLVELSQNNEDFVKIFKKLLVLDSDFRDYCFSKRQTIVPISYCEAVYGMHSEYCGLETDRGILISEEEKTTEPLRFSQVRAHDPKPQVATAADRDKMNMDPKIIRRLKKRLSLD